MVFVICVERRNNSDPFREPLEDNPQVATALTPGHELIPPELLAATLDPFEVALGIRERFLDLIRLDAVRQNLSQVDAIPDQVHA